MKRLKKARGDGRAAGWRWLSDGWKTMAAVGNGGVARWAHKGAALFSLVHAGYQVVGGYSSSYDLLCGGSDSKEEDRARV